MIYFPFTTVFSDDFSNDSIVYFKYAPIASVDAERSFLACKAILSQYRRSFENLRKHLIIQCNNDRKKKINFFSTIRKNILVNIKNRVRFIFQNIHKPLK